MKVFVAGGSGTIGVPLVRALVAAGHEVAALTRSPGKQAELSALGARPVLADALDREALVAAVKSVRPTHVIHQLTALPKEGMVRSTKDLEPTNRLRTDGTRNLLEAAIQAGARRFIVGSFAILSDRGKVAAPGGTDEAANAVRSMESQVMDATKRGAIEGDGAHFVRRYRVGQGIDVQCVVGLRDQRVRMFVRRRGIGHFHNVDLDGLRESARARCGKIENAEERPETHIGIIAAVGDDILRMVLVREEDCRLRIMDEVDEMVSAGRIHIEDPVRNEGSDTGTMTL